MVSEVWASEATIQDYYASGTPSMFNFDAGGAEGKLIQAARTGTMSSLIQAMITYQNDFGAQNSEYIDAPFLTNHDMVRVANALVCNEDKLKSAAGLLMMMNGSPFVYYGEEIGMKSAGTKDENKRIPMVWSDTDLTGATDGPQDMDAGITSDFPAVDEQLADESSLLNYYKRALRLRNENPEIARGTVAQVDALCEGTQAAITKTYEDSTIGILYNMGEESVSISLKDTELSGMQLRGYLTLNNETVTLTDDVVELPARSIVIVK
jgi:glycosidase